MCLAIFRPSGAGNVSDADLASACAKNPDGFGFAALVDGALVTRTFGPGDRAKFIAEYRVIEAAGGALLAHARFATHGAKVAANAHPFTYTDPAGFEVAVIHNGVLDIETANGESDTEVFVRKVLANMPTRWWDSPTLMYLMAQTIGRSNKLVLMTSEGEVIIVNEKQGTWRDGIWYSNTYSLAQSWQVGGYKPQGLVTTPAVKVRKPSKREQQRAAKAAHKATKAGGSRRPASMPVERSLTVVRRSLNLTHMGHIVDALDDLPLDTDNDYPASILCTVCHTLGDAYVVDGARYLDLSHLADVPHDDALSAAGM